MRLASVVGARPQFVKLAPVSRALRRRHDEIIIHTGRHYDDHLSATFFAELSIPSLDYNLGIGSGPHGMQTGRMLEAIEEVLLAELPDAVIVYGDTNSTLAAALAAVQLHIPVAHVEAGLRSFNREMPEEINRVVADHVASRLLCPTQTAVRHLAAEGIVAGVENVGDVMYDVLRAMQPRLEQRAQTLLPSLHVAPREFVLATIHRPVNTDDAEAMRGIAAALGALELPVVFPMHPRTRRRTQEYGILWSERVRLLEPVGYVDMLALECAAHRVVTDSGGVQKEAFPLGVPCVTVRDETEWTETVEGGWNTLAGNHADAIVAAVRRPAPPPAQRNPFGAGDAAARIAQSFDTWPLGG
jgi:UDP-GlcNAc3NAcA epimerase